MCNYKNLASSEWGYVVRCNSCNHFHAAFGTSVLRLSNDEFLSFVDEVKSKLELHEDIHNRKIKAIAIETAHKNVGLIYTYNELQKFFSILAEARDVLNKEILFNFCDN